MFSSEVSVKDMGDSERYDEDWKMNDNKNMKKQIKKMKKKERMTIILLKKSS